MHSQQTPTDTPNRSATPPGTAPVHRLIAQADADFKHIQGGAAANVRFGKRLRKIHDHRLYGPSGDEAWHLFCKGHYGISGQWAIDHYIWIGDHYQVAEVQGRCLTGEALKAIGKEEPPCKALLLELGQHRTLKEIEAAIEQARLCRTQEEKLAAIRAVLGPEGPRRPEPRPAGPEQPKPPRVPLAKRVGTAALKAVQKVKDKGQDACELLNEGVALPEEVATELRKELPEAIKQQRALLKRLNRRDPDRGGPGGSGEDDSGEDDSGEDDSGEDDSGEDGSGEDGSGEDGSGEDGSGEDGSGEDGGGEDGSGEDGGSEDGSGEDTTIENTTTAENTTTEDTTEDTTENTTTAETTTTTTTENTTTAETTTAETTTTEPATSALLVSTPPGPPAPAKEPPRWTDTQLNLPVPYPLFAGLPDFNPPVPVRHACRLLMLITLASKMGSHLFHLVRQGSFPSLLRQHSLVSLFSDSIDPLFCELKDLLEPATSPLLEQLGLRHLYLYDPARGPLPVSQDPRELLPMDWLSVEVPPLRDPDLPPVDQLTDQFLSCLQMIEPEVLSFARGGGLGQQVGPDLLLQLGSTLVSTQSTLGGLVHRLKPGAEAGRLLLEQQEQQGLLTRVTLERDLVLVGSDVLTSAFVALGKTLEGIPVGADLLSPGFTLFLGETGVGKTHGIRLMEEGMGAPYPGLAACDSERYRIIRFSVNNGDTVNDQLMAGFAPNPYPESWDRLERQWGISWVNRAFRKGWFFCFQDCLPRYRRLYAPYVERGLCIEPLQIHPEELGYVAYEAAILGGGVQSQEGRASWCKLLRAIVADLGPGARPLRVLAEMKRHKADYRVLGALEAQLPLLQELCSEQVHLVDSLEAGGSVGVQLESEYWGPELVLPVQVMTINALGRPLRSGHKVMKYFDLDEVTLQLKGKTAVDQMLRIGTLRRHGWTSVGCAAQGASSVPRRLAGLPTVVVQMHTPSSREWKMATELWGFFEGSWERRIKPLEKYQGLMGATQATDRRFKERAQVVTFRDSILWTAGETRRLDEIDE